MDRWSIDQVHKRWFMGHGAPSLWNLVLTCGVHMLVARSTVDKVQADLDLRFDSGGADVANETHVADTKAIAGKHVAATTRLTQRGFSWRGARWKWGGSDVTATSTEIDDGYDSTTATANGCNRRTHPTALMRRRGSARGSTTVRATAMARVDDETAAEGSSEVLDACKRIPRMRRCDRVAHEDQWSPATTRTRWRWRGKAAARARRRDGTTGPLRRQGAHHLEHSILNPAM